MNDNATGGTPDGGFDINSVLGTSPQGDTAGTGSDQSVSAQGEGTQAGTFKFGGKDYASQSDAEKAFNKLYGKFSEGQGLQKQLTQLLRRDPNALAELAQDPEWAEMLSKMGIDAASKEVSDRQNQERAEAPQNWDEYRQQWDVERHQFRLEQEQSKFEKKLGRDLAPDEARAVFDIIGNAPSLSIEQAYRLAFHDKLLKEAVAKATSGRSANTSGRPKPPPSLMPGSKLDMKKPIHLQNKDEARESMRADIREHFARSG